MKFVTLMILLLPTGVLATGKGETVIHPALLELVKNIDEKSATIESLEADFLQIKELSLLTEPVQMRGRLYLKKQKGIAFLFEPEEDLKIVITSEEMVAISPKAKKADRIKIKRRNTLLTSRLLTEKLRTLLDHFAISRLAGTTQDGSQCLILTPTRRRMKKKFEEIRLWVNPEFLIQRMRVKDDNGDVYELALSQIKINGELADALFDTTIPEDFTLGDRVEMFLGSDLGL